MDSKERNRTTRQVATITGLCLLAVVCNLGVPGIFWDLYQGSWFYQVTFVACGALVAEVCLLGIWCGLGRQAIKYRLPATLALVLIAACSFTMGVQLADAEVPDQGMPIEGALLIVAAGFGMFAALQVPLWLIRRATRRRIARPESAPFEDSLQGRQFSLGYLMLWTALVGVLLVLVRNSLPERSVGPPLRELMDIVMVMLAYIGLSSLLSIPCVWIVLTERPQLGSALLLAGTLLVGPFFMLLCTNMIFGQQDAGEMLLGEVCYEVGLSGTTLAVLLVLRSLGYRMLVVGP